MKYLFDTDTISGAIRARPSATLRARLQDCPAEDQATSSITLGELLFGAYRLGQAGTDLLRRIEQETSEKMMILPFDDMAARVYARLRMGLEAAGTPIGEADTRIAAIALANGLVVVTGNVRHFERVSALTVENWMAPEGDADDSA